MTASPHIFSESPLPDAAIVWQDTVRWLERAVIGLNLCPFAKGVHGKGQIHYVVSSATEGAQLLQELGDELKALAEISPEERDTTLLIAPACFPDFLDFNDFLELADQLLNALDLEGILQIASFHPAFQFGGTTVDDVTNCTNRAPYPTLHLLREDSIDRAVAAFPDLNWGQSHIKIARSPSRSFPWPACPVSRLRVTRTTSSSGATIGRGFLSTGRILKPCWRC